MADVGGFPAVEEHDAPRAENKRKFDDTGVADELGLRYSNSAGVGGGSDGDAPPVPAVAPVSYNSVAPPMSEFELAKQRAELIAARLVTGAELKRPRTEESSEEQQQQQQNGADRSNGSDFDQAYPDRNQEDDRPPEDHHSELIHQHQQHQQPSFQHPPSQDYQPPAVRGSALCFCGFSSSLLSLGVSRGRVA